MTLGIVRIGHDNAAGITSQTLGIRANLVLGCELEIDGIDSSHITAIGGEEDVAVASDDVAGRLAFSGTQQFGSLDLLDTLHRLLVDYLYSVGTIDHYIHLVAIHQSVIGGRAEALSAVVGSKHLLHRNIRGIVDACQRTVNRRVHIAGVDDKGAVRYYLVVKGWAVVVVTGCEEQRSAYEERHHS